MARAAKAACAATATFTVPDLGRLPCERCRRHLGDMSSFCALPPRARKRCGSCHAAKKTCRLVCRTKRVKRILALRGFIWFRERLDLRCRKQRKELALLANEEDAPRRAKLSFKGRKAALAGVAKRRAAAGAVPVVEEEEMEAVVWGARGVDEEMGGAGSVADDEESWEGCGERMVERG